MGALTLLRPSSRLSGSAMGRRYWLFWSAALLSGLGDGVVLVAFPLLAATLTTDPRSISGVAVAAALPWLLFGLPAGVIADHFNRRRLMAGVEFFRAAMIGVFALFVSFGRVPMAAVYAAVFLLGTAQTLFVAAAGIEVPRLVDDRHLGRANGYLLAAETAGEQTIGPAIGGVLAAWAIAVPFFVDGISFVVSALLVLAALTAANPASAATERRASLDGGHMRLRLLIGWRLFLRDDLLLALAGIISVLAFCQAMVTSTLVLDALGPWGLDARGFGLLLGCAAVGNVVGGIVGGWIEERVGAALSLTGSALAAGVGYAVIGFATSAVIAGVGLAIEAAAVMIGNVASITLRQRIVPASVLGTVGNIIRWCIFGSMPLGALTGGVLAAQSSLRTPILLAAVTQLVAVAVFAPGLAALVRSRGWPIQPRRVRAERLGSGGLTPR